MRDRQDGSSGAKALEPPLTIIRNNRASLKAVQGVAFPMPRNDSSQAGRGRAFRRQSIAGA
jgi:hypothetical protein